MIGIAAKNGVMFSWPIYLPVYVLLHPTYVHTSSVAVCTVVHRSLPALLTALE